MLFLQHGVDQHGAWIAIDQVPSGQTALGCPYCGGLLIAKKGNQIAHHFAHKGETCHPAARDPAEIALPAYDNFTLHLPGRAVKELRAWAMRDSEQAYDEEYLARHGLLQWNGYQGRYGGYELTKSAKVVLGQLSLNLFNQFQEPLILERHAALEQKARDARGSVDFDTRLTDLRLYRAQLRRILSATLYFLRVGEGNLYKIGVTTRSVEERVAEIAAELRPHLGDVKITVVGTWAARGNVEFYFKHRYQRQRQALGNLTEYFTFEDIKPVLSDLRRMKPKQFTDMEQQALLSEKSDLECAREAEQIEARRRVAIQSGLRRAASRGKVIGRPKGAAPPEQILTKPYAAAVKAALEAGYSLREAARIADVAVNTVRKVAAAVSAPPALAVRHVFTHSDLPVTDNLQQLFSFCAEKAGTLRWRDWQGGEVAVFRGVGTDKPAYYFMPPEYGEGILYMGRTLQELRDTLLLWLNAGKDVPLRRLRLTQGERRLLRRLSEEQFLATEQLTGRESVIAKSLVDKGLATPFTARGRYDLTPQGCQLADRLRKRPA